MMYWLAFLATYSVTKFDSLIPLLDILLGNIWEMTGFGWIMSWRRGDYLLWGGELNFEVGLMIEGFKNILGELASSSI